MLAASERGPEFGWSRRAEIGLGRLSLAPFRWAFYWYLSRETNSLYLGGTTKIFPEMARI